MAQATPFVSDDMLVYSQCDQEQTLLVESPAWYAWLATATIFAFSSPSGTFTARKEQVGNKRGGWYWKAYRKRKGTLYHAYLGKSEELMLTRLHAVAAMLARQHTDDDQQDEHHLERRALPDLRSSKHSKRSLRTPPIQVESFVEQRTIMNSHLPVPPTPFIGREQEVQVICSLLRCPEVRLLTLTGFGGAGKTRLALQVAQEVMHDFAGGICFVPLAPLSDPGLVLPALSSALGLTEVPDRPLFEQLQANLHDAHLLLLLDNFEHLLIAVPYLAELLATCPSLKALVTSRSRLHVHGEHVWPVPPLSLPELEHHSDIAFLAQSAAVELFVQRAQAISPDFILTLANASSVAEICVRLDGLPLAIELAAACISLLSPQELLSRLTHRLQVLTGGPRDAPLRQQTLRNTLKWSYELLDVHQQHLFRRLAVFVGGWTLEAVEAVCYQEQDLAAPFLDEVASLLDKSLLQRVEQEEGEGELRLHMLTTVRDFALEYLESAGEADRTRNAHAAYYLAQAEQAEPYLTGHEQMKWLIKLDHEYDNLRMALTWLLERAQVEGTAQAERALRLCAALYRYWWTRGHLREGSTFLERALMVREGIAPLVQARVLYAAAMAAFILYGVERAEVLCKESLALSREIGETTGIANGLFLLGRLARNRCQYATAHAHLQEAVALFKAVNNARQSSLCLAELALVLIPRGEYGQARALLEESQALARNSGDTTLVAWALYQLALMLFLSQADSSKARTLAEESLSLYKTMEDDWHVAYNLNLLGEMRLVQGEHILARELFEQSLAAFTAIGSQVDIAEFQISLARVLVVQGDVASARALYRESLAVLVEIDDKEPIPACLEGLGAAMVKQGAAQEAARLWGRAEALREVIGAPIPPVYRATYDHTMVAARAQLGAKTFAKAWAEGRSMTLKQVLAASELVANLEPVTTSPVGLTAREVEVLRLVAQGLTDAQIAERLVISPHTVHAHLSSIYGKLGISSRSSATRYALERPLI